MADLHIAAAAKRAADFERAMQKVSNQLRLNPEQVDRMRDELEAAAQVWRAAPWWWRIQGRMSLLLHWRELRG